MAECAQVECDFSSDSKPLGVKMFVDGNLDKRFEKLLDALDFLSPAFKQFDELIVSYIRATPLAAYDTGGSDAERMLDWLQRTRKLSARQQDYIACQRARHAVEEAAREDRLAYVRFQERWSVTPALAADLPTGVALLYLNPIRIWTTFRTTTLLGEGAEPPCQVVFFPVQGEISTAALDDRGAALLAELAALCPVGFDSWAAVTQHADSDDLLQTVRDLAEMGLVAVA